MLTFKGGQSLSLELRVRTDLGLKTNRHESDKFMNHQESVGTNRTYLDGQQVVRVMNVRDLGSNLLIV